MCGLIWKDFLVLRKTLRLYVLFLLGYLGMALLGIFDLTFGHRLLRGDPDDPAHLCLLL